MIKVKKVGRADFSYSDGWIETIELVLTTDEKVLDDKKLNKHITKCLKSREEDDNDFSMHLEIVDSDLDELSLLELPVHNDVMYGYIYLVLRNTKIKRIDVHDCVWIIAIDSEIGNFVTRDELPIVSAVNSKYPWHSSICFSAGKNLWDIFKRPASYDTQVVNLITADVGYLRRVGPLTDIKPPYGIIHETLGPVIVSDDRYDSDDASNDSYVLTLNGHLNKHVFKTKLSLLNVGYKFCLLDMVRAQHSS